MLPRPPLTGSSAIGPVGRNLWKAVAKGRETSTVQVTARWPYARPSYRIPALLATMDSDPSAPTRRGADRTLPSSKTTDGRSQRSSSSPASRVMPTLGLGAKTSFTPPEAYSHPSSCALRCRADLITSFSTTRPSGPSPDPENRMCFLLAVWSQTCMSWKLADLVG